MTDENINESGGAADQSSPESAVGYAAKAQHVLEIIDELETLHREWEPLQTRADQKAYALLAAIYTRGVEIDGDDDKRHALHNIMRSCREFIASKKWSPGSRPAGELIVTYLLGLKKCRTRKHNWISALAYAEECDVEATESAFEAWISSKEIGGIDGAVELFRGDSPSTSPIDLSGVAAELQAKDGEVETIDVALGTSLPSGLAVLIVHKRDDGHADILRKVVKESMVRRVLKDIQVFPKSKKFSPAQVANAERQSLLALTKVAVKLADGRDPKDKDCRALDAAIKRLNRIPELRDQYFDGHPFAQIRFSGGTPGAVSTIGTINPDFDPLDPARYITGAKKGKLFPYEYDPEVPKANLGVARAFIEQSRRPKENKGPKGAIAAKGLYQLPV